MLLILEIVFLITGAWAIIAGSLPPVLLSFLFGKGDYRVDENMMRLFGLLLVSPLPIAFIGSILLYAIWGEAASGSALLLEVGVVVAVAIAAKVFSQKFRFPDERDNKGSQELRDIELAIEGKARGALIYAISGVLGPVAFIFGPLAFLRATQALRLIEQHDIGNNYRVTANMARVISATFFLLYGGLCLWFLSSVWLLYPG